MDQTLLKELGGFFVMLNKSLVGVEGTSDIGVGNDFRRIGLVREDSTNFGTSTVASATTRRQLYVYQVWFCIRNIYCFDEEINQASTGGL